MTSARAWTWVRPIFSPAADAPCALFAPLHYESNYAYPLLVWLHGPDDDENQLKRLMPLLSMRNYVGVAPRGTVSLAAARPPGDSTPGEIRRPTWRWRSSTSSRALPPHGASSTCTGSACSWGASIAAAAWPSAWPCCTRVFRGRALLGRPVSRRQLPAALTEARHLNLFIASGATSEHYPAERVCDDLRLLHSAGMHITLRHYPCGHVITSDMLSDMNRWIMELVTSPALAAK